MNAKPRLPKEIKNLQIVLSAFEDRKPIIKDFDTKISRLKSIMQEKKCQLQVMPKVK